MLIKYFVVFTVVIYSVSSEDCVTYTFGEDFSELFADDFVGCTNHQWTRLQWSHEVYSNSTIVPPNENSKWFITPPGGFSCTSSFLFTMTPGGLLEVLTYRESTPGNSLSMLVHEYGNNRLAARIQVNDPGWHVSKIPLSGTTDFVGYITFTGTKTINSVVIIDSFRYVAPSSDPEKCVVYPDNNATLSTTTDILTTTDIPTTDTTTQNNDCVKYTFEEDFEELFTNNTQCSNMFGVDTSWSRHEYSNTSLSPPNKQSKWFITPSSSYSCISSFNFTMMSEGLIEVHAYIDTKEQADYLEVWVHKIVDSNYHTVAGHVFVHNVDPGWNVLNISLFDESATPFEGYITFTGVANLNSYVIVDSFRYVAPTLNPNQCILYQDDPNTITPTTIQTTTEITDLIDECVKYIFEEDFEELFVSNTQCSNMFGVDTSWSRHEYSNTTITPLFEQSTGFISPSSSYSCISTFNFTMTSAGVIDIYLYVDAKERDDSLEVWVYKILNSNSNSLVGRGFLHAVNDGWLIMSIFLSGENSTPFEGFITFTGQANPNSVVIVDSFRYVGPSFDPEGCVLYPDELTTVQTPTDTTLSTTTDGTSLTSIDGTILTTTDKPTLTTTDITGPESNKTLEKIIITKTIKTIRIESTVIKKVYRLNKK